MAVGAITQRPWQHDVCVRVRVRRGIAMAGATSAGTHMTPLHRGAPRPGGLGTPTVPNHAAVHGHTLRGIALVCTMAVSGVT